MGLVSGLSLANHSDSESFLVVHTLFSQDGCQREGFWEVVGHVVSPFDLSRTLLVRWLISSVFLSRTSCHKTTHANVYYGAWPGWAVSVSVFPSFMLMLFVLPWKTWNVVKPWTWLARSLPGDQQSQDSFPILSMMKVLHSQETVGALTVREVSR